MSATSLFFSGPEMTMTWSGFYTSMKQEAKIGNVAIRCPEISLKGNCCLTCRAAAGELSSLCEEVVVIQHTDEKVQCQDIASLRYQLWKEASKQGGKERCRGLVLILHDFSMESGRACRNTAPRLLAEGYAVAGFDLRGHGKSSDRSDSFDATQSLRRFFSGSRRVVVDGDDCWIQMQRWRSDIMTVVRRACQDIDAEQSLPVYLFGDGFGAAMAIEFVASSQASLMKDLHIRGVAASGALLGLNNGASFKETYKYLDSMRNSKVLADKYIIFPADLDDLSRDLRVGEMVRKDQLRLKQADALMLKVGRPAHKMDHIQALNKHTR